jgi:hypothetical protein
MSSKVDRASTANRKQTVFFMTVPISENRSALCSEDITTNHPNEVARPMSEALNCALRILETLANCRTFHDAASAIATQLHRKT